MSMFQPDSGSTPAVKPGRVSLVGAGPGDPELLTLKAARLIGEAEVILHDRLIGDGVLRLASATAHLVDVGKRCGRHSMPQSEINRLIVNFALSGANVVRLKGGDPFVFGRGGEEIDAVRAAGLACEIVPGITAACAAAAQLGIPLTQRGIGRALHFVSGHGADAEDIDYDWAALARSDATLVVYMGARSLRTIADRMIAAGVSLTLPAVAIENATLPTERRLAGTVGTIAAMVDIVALDGPTLIIFGEVTRALSSLSHVVDGAIPAESDWAVSTS